MYLFDVLKLVGYLCLLGINKVTYTLCKLTSSLKMA